MFNQTREWARWAQAVVKWRFYVNMYDLKEWLALNRICKFKRAYTRQDLMRLGLLADLGVFTPSSYSVRAYNRLKRQCEDLSRECEEQAKLLESIYCQIGGGGYASYRIRNTHSSFDGT